MKTLSQLAISAAKAEDVKAGLLCFLNLFSNETQNDLVKLILNAPEEQLPMEVIHKSNGVQRFSSLRITGYGIEVECTFTNVGDYWFRSQEEANEAIEKRNTYCSKPEETASHTVKATVEVERLSCIELHQWLKMDKA